MNNDDNDEETTRFYMDPFPKPDQFVMVRIGKRNEYGYPVNLLEYDNLEGFVFLIDLMRRARHRKKNIVKEGEIYPMMVMRVEKNIVNVAKKYVTDKDLPSIEKNYSFSCKLYKLGYEIFKSYQNYNDTNADIEKVFSATVWRLIKNNNEDNEETIKPRIEEESNEEESDTENKENNEEEKEEEENTLEKLYNNILLDPKILFDDETFPEDFINEYISNIKSRIVKTNSKMKTVVKVLTLSEKGVDALKEIFNVTLDKEHKEYKLNIDMISSPMYKISVEGQDEDKIKQLINEVTNTIRNNVKKSNGIFSIQQEITVTKKTELDVKFLSKFDLDKNKL